MNNTDEKFAVHTVLAGAVPLACLSIAVPPVGYALTGIVALGILALIGRGVFLWWDTRLPHNTQLHTSTQPAPGTRDQQKAVA